MEDKDKKKARMKIYRQKNREKINEKHREWYAANHDEQLEKQRAYRAANRERLNAQSKEWKDRNRERVRENNRAYYAAHKKEISARKREYATRKKQERESKTTFKKDWDSVMKRLEELKKKKVCKPRKKEESGTERMLKRTYKAYQDGSSCKTCKFFADVGWCGRHKFPTNVKRCCNEFSY